MATFTGNTVEAASGSGGPIFVFDTITALTADCPVTKIVFGNDAEIAAAWSFNTGALDDGTPRVTLATDDPAVAALEAIESYLDTEVAAILTGVQLIDDVIETNRAAVNLIVGQVGITAGAGAVAANTPRVTLASDDPGVAQLSQIAADGIFTRTNTANSAASLAIIDGWDESGRAKVDLIVGQLGIAAGAGVVSVSTPRVTLASDDPAVALLTTIDADTSGIFISSQDAAASLAVIDDWDESNRAKVNLIVGQAGVSAGAGIVGANTLRITHASDDLAVTALQIIDDWDETDRAKVNLIVGQAGITAGAGAVGLNTPRVTLASDDPAVALLTTIDADTGNLSGILTALQIIDDWDESDRAKVNPIVGQAGVQGSSGIVTATTQRVTIATNDSFLKTSGVAAASTLVQIGIEGTIGDPSPVDSGDAVRPLGSLLGKQVNLPYAVPARTWQYASVSGGITDTADDQAVAAAAAGIRNYITHCSVVNASSSVSTEVVIKDGSTIIWRGWAQANGGGVAEKFDPPLRGTAATAVNVTNITTGAQTYFNLQGYAAAE